MANKYLKGSRRTEYEFLVILRLFIEDKTAVEIEKVLINQFEIKYDQNSLNGMLNKIRFSILENERSGNRKLFSCSEINYPIAALKNTEYEYKYPRKDRYWSDYISNIKNYLLKTEFFWVHIMEGKLYLKHQYCYLNKLKQLPDLFEFSIDNKLYCHGLILYKDGILTPLYSGHSGFDDFLKFHSERIKKFNGLLDGNKAGYFFESILRFNCNDNNLLEEKLLVHLENYRIKELALPNNKKNS